MSKTRAQRIKVLLFDVDGVMTDGTLWFLPGPAGDAAGKAGAVEVKGFHAHDGAGISLARLAGLKCGLITKRSSVTVAVRARDLKLDFVYQGCADKAGAMREILKKEKVGADEVCFIGDDIIDLPVMRRCGLAVAVANAREEVKDEAHFITDRPGGRGAIREVIEYILRAQGKLEAARAEYIQDRSPKGEE
jgi:3-deoxy-D-manno-octulosonate 8-phosphate phosphatase (KDO 8-P phosphatase)